MSINCVLGYVLGIVSILILSHLTHPHILQVRKLRHRFYNLPQATQPGSGGARIRAQVGWLTQMYTTIQPENCARTGERGPGLPR